jgi:hypothetical protein
MKRAMTAVALLALAGCTKGTIEDYKWTVECPQTVDKGTEFNLLVNTSHKSESADGATESPAGGVPFHYQVQWPGGTSMPLRHNGYSGEPIRIRARMSPGPATILITALNREGLDVKVQETKIEVK